ncbi:MAG: hypothetical protein V1817_01135 [Candidatus Micrarchaeota archaeon]
MDLASYRVEFKPGWDRYFKDFDKSVQKRIIKKLEQMKRPLQARGLHASRFRVEETGGYRIAFIQDDVNRVKRIHFVGSHPQYEK